MPVTYFLEKPFQNWTRASANLLGAVFLYANYMIPVDELRRALHDILRSSDNWDGQVWGLQVSNAGERTIESRSLTGARRNSRQNNQKKLLQEAIKLLTKKGLISRVVFDTAQSGFK